jgi:hypothetical protein
VGALSDLPLELVVGWALWMVGGLALTFWFVRQSASPRLREVAPMPTPAGAAHLSGTHTAAARPVSGSHRAARPQSGVRTVARSQSGTRPAAVRPPSGVYDPDAFDELRALLDPPDQEPGPK